MKIIDLLNKIANGEEVPKYISYYNKKESMSMIMFPCKDNIIIRLNEDAIDLGDEVEILEEEKKIPEKIEYYDDSIAWVIDDVGQLSDVDKVIIDKLNDVIDYLKSKGDK